MYSMVKLANFDYLDCFACLNLKILGIGQWGSDNRGWTYFHTYKDLHAYKCNTTLYLAALDWLAHVCSG